MFSPDNADQTTTDRVDAGHSDVERESAHTEPHLRSVDHRTLLAERRQTILQQKQTDALPKVTVEAANAKLAWRQMIVLREENRRLHAELDEVRAEMQRIVSAYNALQAQFDKEVATVHSGNAQELEFYHKHLSELQAECNRLQEQNTQLERRYQELYSSFRDAVDEEARTMVQHAARTLELPSEETPLLLQDVVKTIELHAQEVEDSQLVEVLHLKQEVQRMSELLEQERRQNAEERQQLLIMRSSVPLEAQRRYKTMQQRLHLRWKASYVFMIGLMLVLLVGLQLGALLLLHIPVVQALLLPPVVCVIVAGILVNPLSHARHLYQSAPYKKKAEKDAPRG